jgi:hypothetical protein
MTRPIQRKTGKRKTKIPEVQVESNNNDSGTQQTNTQVVKIILEQPKTKPRKRAVKKKDNKKDEAIQELKDEVASYDETINDAKSADIEIPKELGISPSEASSLKTTSDILAFIQQIRVKKEKIKNLSSPPPQRTIPPPPRQNMFIPQFPIRAGFNPPTVFEQAQLPQNQPRLNPPTNQIDKQLSELEKNVDSVNQDIDIGADPGFESFLKKVDDIINNQKSIADQAFQLNGRYSSNQGNRYIESFNGTRSRLLSTWNKLPQDIKAIYEDKVNLLEKKIDDEVSIVQSRIETFALPPPSVGNLSAESKTLLEDWRKQLISSNKEIARETKLFESKIALKTLRVEDIIGETELLNNYEANIRRVFDNLPEDVKILEQGDLDDAINRINLLRQILSDTHIGEPRLGPGPARQIPEEEEKEDEVIDADKEADKQRDLKDLRDYVSGTSNKQGFSNWSTKIAEALERLGIDKAEVAAIKLTVKNRKNKVAAIVQRLGPRDRIPLPPRQPQAPSREPKCSPGDRRSMCSQPSSQPVIIPGREVDRSLGIPRNVPRNVPTTGKTPQGRTIINTSSYQEYFRLKRENERNPNVLVQAPFMGNQSASGAFSGSTSEREIAGARNFSSESADLSSGSLGSVPKFTSNRRN